VDDGCISSRFQRNGKWGFDSLLVISSFGTYTHTLDSRMYLREIFDLRRKDNCTCIQQRWRRVHTHLEQRVLFSSSLHIYQKFYARTGSLRDYVSSAVFSFVFYSFSSTWFANFGFEFCYDNFLFLGEKVVRGGSPSTSVRKGTGGREAVHHDVFTFCFSYVCSPRELRWSRKSFRARGLDG
jgi:hypothetical protein